MDLYLCMYVCMYVFQFFISNNKEQRTINIGTMLRRAIVEVLVMFLIISWVAPVTLLSFIFSKESLSGFFPWVGDLCDR